MLNRTITNFFNSSDLFISLGELRPTETRPFCLVIRNLLYKTRTVTCTKHMCKLEVFTWLTVNCNGKNISSSGKMSQGFQNSSDFSRSAPSYKWKGGIETIYLRSTLTVIL